jgi:hypothetical protein
MSNIHDAIAEARGLVESAQRHLALAILTACPLPHDFVQHRDGKPPWCKTCGYAVTGERVKTPEMGA